jgi:outer membrane biosynthesis protein TonB
MAHIRGLTTLFVLAAAVVVLRAADYVPASRLSGDVPNPPYNAIGWVEAVVDIEVDSSGSVSNWTGLRATPGGLNAVLPALKNWKFKAAHDGESSVGSHVLFGAMFRPAQLFDPAGGSAAEDLKPPVKEVPFPLALTRPAYPIKVVGNRSVLVEVLLKADGSVDKTTVVTPKSGWDDASLTAAKGWSFRPPVYKDKAVAGVAYLVFGFRMPV